MRYHGHMPSWNIHIAHVEHLLGECSPDELGIADVNAFLFGNLVPDVCVGFMVPDSTMRIDYRITHMTPGHVVPVPDADRFWNAYMVKRRVKTESGLSLLLGVWAHLATDRAYNGRFRDYCASGAIEIGEDLRVRKQADFDLFGRMMPLSMHVQVTPELLEAAYDFPAYRILADDVERAVAVADRIVDGNEPSKAACDHYQQLDAAWLQSAFDDCNEHLAAWLRTWHRLENAGEHPDADQIIAEI